MPYKNNLYTTRAICLCLSSNVYVVVLSRAAKRVVAKDTRSAKSRCKGTHFLRDNRKNGSKTHKIRQKAQPFRAEHLVREGKK